MTYSKHPNKHPNKHAAKQALGFAAWLLLCFGAGAVGAIASANAGTFFGQLVRPSWAPPGWLFGPVWSMLYLMMAVAAWLVWREPLAHSHHDNSGNPGNPAIRGALALFLAQLAVNALWSWLFFAWRLGAWAFADIVLMWLLIVCTIVAFWRIKPLAGMLLLPYLAWVSFAGALNVWLWRANPALLS